jgi:hypothetical protein
MKSSRATRWCLGFARAVGYGALGIALVPVAMIAGIAWLLASVIATLFMVAKRFRRLIDE